MKRIVKVMLILACVLGATAGSGLAVAHAVSGEQIVRSAAPPRPQLDFTPPDGARDLRALAPMGTAYRPAPSMAPRRTISSRISWLSPGCTAVAP